MINSSQKHVYDGKKKNECISMGLFVLGFEQAL